jgi:hypothetical protein
MKGLMSIEGEYDTRRTLDLTRYPGMLECDASFEAIEELPGYSGTFYLD